MKITVSAISKMDKDLQLLKNLYNSEKSHPSHDVVTKSILRSIGFSDERKAFKRLEMQVSRNIEGKTKWNNQFYTILRNIRQGGYDNEGLPAFGENGMVQKLFTEFKKIAE